MPNKSSDFQVQVLKLEPYFEIDIKSEHNNHPILIAILLGITHRLAETIEV